MHLVQFLNLDKQEALKYSPKLEDSHIINCIKKEKLIQPAKNNKIQHQISADSFGQQKLTINEKKIKTCSRVWPWSAQILAETMTNTSLLYLHPRPRSVASALYNPWLMGIWWRGLGEIRGDNKVRGQIGDWEKMVRDLGWRWPRLGEIGWANRRMDEEVWLGDLQRSIWSGMEKGECGLIGFAGLGYESGLLF